MRAADGCATSPSNIVQPQRVLQASVQRLHAGILGCSQQVAVRLDAGEGDVRLVVALNQLVLA